MMTSHALTIDVEEWFHATALEPGVTRRPEQILESRVTRSTLTVLDILGEAKTRATFFVLGCVAETCPDLVRRIADGGHEVASHGYSHSLLTRQTPTEFREELTRAVRVCEDLTGKAVLGYRAPSFSLVPETAWAFDALIDLGLRYDSSMRSIPEISLPRPHWVIRPGGSRILEYPVSSVRMLGLNLPVGGGGYLRVTPYGITRHFLRRFDRNGIPANVFLHPWEVDVNHPRLDGIGWLSHFRHYVGLRTMESKLRRLLRDFRFGSIRDILQLS